MEAAAEAAEPEVALVFLVVFSFLFLLSMELARLVFGDGLVLWVFLVRGWLQMAIEGVAGVWVAASALSCEDGRHVEVEGSVEESVR